MSSPPPDFSPVGTGLTRLLDPLEQLMLVDARPGYSMCFFVECEVDGPLDEPRLRGALRVAAERHPLTRSRVVRRGWRWHWREPDVMPALLWRPVPPEQPWRPPDLRAESGVRLVVLAGAGEHRHRVILHVQHAVCDGLAAFEFLGDLWASYDGREPPPFVAVTRPGRSEEPAAAPPATAAARRHHTLEFTRFRPQPLAPVRGQLPGAAAPCPLSPPYVVRVLDHDVTARLRRGATDRGISVNDVVVTAVMRAAIAWNEQAAGAPGNVRINMPVSLRPPGSRQPARNVLGYAFLDRTPAGCRDREPLAASNAAATRWILGTNAAAAFLTGLRPLDRLPGLLRLFTRLPLCHSTGVVSCAGDPSRRMRSGVGRVDGLDAPGGLVIRGVWGVPPLRPRTRVAIGATTYAGTLALCCTCSAGSDPQGAARRFLDLVQPELEAFGA